MARRGAAEGSGSGNHHDVVILGTGLASLALTRMLLLDRPDLSILTLDAAAGPSRKVGESTVEIGAHFLHSRLRLAAHLYRTQLPKNGLRFWFDDEEHTQSLGESSEDGPITFSYWQSFQLDRETLEQDILEMNRAAGATHTFAVQGIRIDEEGRDGRPHRISFEKEGRRQEVEARWLVDATGMRSLWGRARGLLEPEGRITHGACWARFRGMRPPDVHLSELGDRRPLEGVRLLSTNHLMNEGYWIWWIPLAGGLMSVGLVYDRANLEDPPTSLEDFVAFLGRHRMCRELMAAAEPVDFGRLGKFAFRPRRYFSTERVAAIGMAAGFIDPFYSGGSDFIALECEYLGDLIERDLDGEAPERGRVAAYNDFVRGFYEQTILYVSGLYPTFASYELCLPRYRRDLHVYWLLFVWPYFSRQFLEPAFIREHEPLLELARQRSELFRRFFLAAHARLAARGELRRRNRGEYAFNQLGFELIPFIRFERQMGHPFDAGLARRLLDEMDAACLLSLLDTLFDGDRSPVRRLLHEALHGGALTAILDLARGTPELDDDFWREALRLLGDGIHTTLARDGIELAEIPLEPAGFARLRDLLLEACSDEEHRQLVDRRYRDLPEPEGLAPLAPQRDRVQPLGTWSFDHSPWPIEPLELRTIYELLAERADTRIGGLYR